MHFGLVSVPLKGSYTLNPKPNMDPHPAGEHSSDLEGALLFNMSYNLNSLKGGYIGAYVEGALWGLIGGILGV